VTHIEKNKFKFDLPENVPKGMYSIMGVANNYKIVFWRDFFMGITQEEFCAQYGIPMNKELGALLFSTPETKYGRKEFQKEKIVKENKEMFPSAQHLQQVWTMVD